MCSSLTKPENLDIIDQKPNEMTVMPNNSDSDDDKKIFQEFMRGVTPLKSKDRVKTVKQELPVEARPKTKIKRVEQYEQALSDYIADAVQSESLLSYCVPGLAANQYRDLKQGTLPIEAKLDLHGLTTEEARGLLIQFIKQQAANQRRCLLIVHGKGGHQGQPPVIKNLINRWLPQFPETLAFHSAKARDGGTGAVYLLIRRS